MGKDERRKMSGIYKITNTEIGLVYIGSTERDTKTRWSEHRAHLRGGYHVNRFMQDDWNKYGEGCFVFEVVEDGSVDKKRETEIILQHAPNCYNTGLPTVYQGEVIAVRSLFKFHLPIKNRKWDRKEKDHDSTI
jgi:hypothetical protein